MSICSDHSKCLSNIFDLVERLCFKEKIILTELRRKILKILSESHAPVKAYDIVDKLKTEKKSIKPISVYRILDLFQKYNVIHKIHSQNSFLMCTHPGQNHSCCFMICRKCNNINELCNDELLVKIKDLSHSSNFEVNNIIIEVLGICNKCG
jgi:Fur family zinc uptake transcriptional regulator